MAAQLPSRIHLTLEEEALASRIDFDCATLGYDPESCLAAGELTKLLLERGAVPQIRLDYFVKPEYNIGSKKSRYEQFEASGVTGEAVFESPHFFEYLRYFIDGPRLPDETKIGFNKIVEDGLFTTSMRRERLRSFSRSEVRRLHLHPKEAAEEFYKLALECTPKHYIAASVRESVRQVRCR